MAMWDEIIDKYRILRRHPNWAEVANRLDDVAVELRFHPDTVDVVPRTSMFSLVLNVPGHEDSLFIEWHTSHNLYHTYIEIFNTRHRHYATYTDRDGIIAAVSQRLNIIRSNHIMYTVDDLTMRKLQALGKRQERDLAAITRDAIAAYLAAHDDGNLLAVRYLTADELIYINEQFPSKAQIHTIVDGKRKVRDMDLLEAAVGRPQSSAFGEDAYPSLEQKATALLHSIARNHPFADGNKRTATVGAVMMLAVNGLRVTWERETALENIVALAEGQLELNDFAQWLPTEPGTPALEPDADADAALIAGLISDHKWLLGELAER